METVLVIGYRCKKVNQTLKMAAFRHVVQCSLVDNDKHFREPLSSGLWYRQWARVKHRSISARLHGTTSQTTSSNSLPWEPEISPNQIPLYIFQFLWIYVLKYVFGRSVSERRRYIPVYLNGNIILSDRSYASHISCEVGGGGGGKFPVP